MFKFVGKLVYFWSRMLTLHKTTQDRDRRSDLHFQVKPRTWWISDTFCMNFSFVTPQMYRGHLHPRRPSLAVKKSRRHPLTSCRSDQIGRCQVFERRDVIGSFATRADFQRRLHMQIVSTGSATPARHRDVKESGWTEAIVFDLRRRHNSRVRHSRC